MDVEGLSSESLRSALAKGLGRALQSARAAGKLVDEEPVLDACVHNRAFDPQLEGSRVSWLIEILTAADAIDRLQAPILRALRNSMDVWDLCQLCDFAEYFAGRGVEEAKAELYRVLDHGGDLQAPWLAQEQIIRLEGLDGLLRIAERRGAAIRRGEDEWDLLQLVRDAERHHPPESVAAALASAESASPDIREFIARLEDERREVERAKRPGSLTTAERMREVTLEQVLEVVAGRSSALAAGQLQAWGRFAPKESLRFAASRMFAEQAADRLVRYLRIFSRTPLPDFDERLIELTTHEHGDVCEWATKALAGNRNPVVRAFALKRLESGLSDGGTIALFKCNYEPGDHHLLESAVAPAGDPADMHDLCWALLDVFSENAVPDGAGLMAFAYEHTPCSTCRERAVARLLTFGRAPPAMIEECRFDSNEDIRELAGGASAQR